MTQIAIGYHIVGYKGAGIDLAVANRPAFLNTTNIKALIGINAGKNGYASFNPASGFNSFNSIPDGTHFIVVALAAFDFPGVELIRTEAPLTWHLEISPVSGIASNGTIASGANAEIKIEQVYSNGTRVDVTESVGGYGFGAGNYSLGYFTADTVTEDAIAAITANYTQSGVSRSASMLISVMEPTSTTPAAPTISANDAANTLQATHSLGASEILVSVAGAAFAQYDGAVIQVGNVARAAGYWQFKTKPATNRNESPVASSPAFTVAPVVTWDVNHAPGGQTSESSYLSSVTGSVFRHNNHLVTTGTTPLTMNIYINNVYIGTVDTYSRYSGRPCQISTPANGEINFAFADGDVYLNS